MSLNSFGFGESNLDAISLFFCEMRISSFGLWMNPILLKCFGSWNFQKGKDTTFLTSAYMALMLTSCCLKSERIFLLCSCSCVDQANCNILFPQSFQTSLFNSTTVCSSFPSALSFSCLLPSEGIPHGRTVWAPSPSPLISTPLCPVSVLFRLKRIGCQILVNTIAHL